jgi:ABC-2 type transport system ATP-binding protein
VISPHRAVVAHELHRHFGAVRAVDGISFDVASGELFGLVGPDGAGKTTTLRMLAGVLPPTSGDAEILGASVARDPEQAKHKIAYMSQRFGLYTDLTVSENLRFYADLYLVPKGEREERLKRLYQFSNLESFKDRLAGQLSGGMKQKLGLSCALIHQPEVLLLDEPTFGVDPVSRRDLWLIVHEMVAQGVTVVVSTAYMDEAERFDRLAFLHRGRILATDTPEALRVGLAGDLVAVQVERLREARTMLRALPIVRDAVIFGDRLHVTVDQAARDIPVVERALAEAGFAAAHIERVAASLEDVFISEVRRAEAA